MIARIQISEREERGIRIANTQGCVFRVDDTHFKVRSQSNAAGFYDIEQTEIGFCQVFNI